MGEQMSGPNGDRAPLPRRRLSARARRRWRVAWELALIVAALAAIVELWTGLPLSRLALTGLLLVLIVSRWDKIDDLRRPVLAPRVIIIPVPEDDEERL